ncbi:MAG TPA: zinc-binding dehydrogenase [Capsulimonadaceae bacterium]
MKSRAIVITGPNAIEMWDYETPALKPGEMLVKTSYSGVSQGTEIWDYIGKRPELSFPNVPGYQSVGEVIDVADGVDGSMIGKTVRYISSRLEAPFTNSWMNCHVEYAVIKDNVLVVPDGVDPIEAAMSCMPAVSLLGNRMLNITIGDVVVVTGQGMIGQGAAQLARLRGATVIAADVSPQRLELSRKYSADYVVNPATEDLEAAVKAIKPDGADIAIDTTGRASMFPTLVNMIRVYGQISLQGWYPDPITFNFHDTHGKRPTIAIPCGLAMDSAVLDLLKERKLHLRGLVSNVESAANAAEMYKRMAAADPSLMGVVFDWSLV